MTVAVAYLRVSTDRQAAEGYSLDRQRVEVAAYCQQHGYELLEIVEDDYTGSLADRPGTRRLAVLAERRAMSVVVAPCLDRLARDSYVGRDLLELLARHGVRTEFAAHRFEDSPTGQFTRNILWEVAGLERQLILARTMSGRRGKALTGRLPAGAAPYGYRLITRAESQALPQYAGRDGELLIREEQALWVRRMYDWAAAGDGPYQIAVRLNAAGVLTRGGTCWDTAKVRALLASTTYRGAFVWGAQSYRMSNELTASGSPARIVTPGEPIEIPCPALVPADLWETAQLAVRAGQRSVGRPTRRYLLRGCVYCSECRGRRGGPLRAVGESGRYRGTRRCWYRCSSSARLDLAYCGTSYPAEELEQRARSALVRASAQETLERMAAALRCPPPETVDHSAALRALTDQERRLVRLLAQGLGSDVVESELRAVQQQRLALGREQAAAVPDTEAPLRLLAAGERLRQALLAAGDDPERLQALYQRHVTAVIYPRRGGREPEIDVTLR